MDCIFFSPLFLLLFPIFCILQTAFSAASSGVSHTHRPANTHWWHCTRRWPRWRRRLRTRRWYGVQQHHGIAAGRSGVVGSRRLRHWHRSWVNSDADSYAAWQRAQWNGRGRWYSRGRAHRVFTTIPSPLSVNFYSFFVFDHRPRFTPVLSNFLICIVRQLCQHKSSSRDPLRSPTASCRPSWPKTLPRVRSC